MCHFKKHTGSYLIWWQQHLSKGKDSHCVDSLFFNNSVYFTRWTHILILGFLVDKGLIKNWAAVWWRPRWGLAAAPGPGRSPRTNEKWKN